MDFAIERPLHYIHHQVDMEADVDDDESDEDDDEDDEGWIWNYEATAKRAVEYDMDEQDMAWLRLWNAERKAEGLERVDEDDFELVIDRLEKYWFHLVKTYFCVYFYNNSV